MGKSIKPKKHEVTWEDAHSPGATVVFSVDDVVGLDDVHTPLQVVTIGWVLRDDEKGITLANEYCGDGDYRGLTFVLRKNIISVHPLSTSRPKKKAPKEPIVVQE